MYDLHLLMIKQMEEIIPQMCIEEGIEAIEINESQINHKALATA